METVQYTSMTSESDIQGRGYVHHIAWIETYTNLIEQSFLDKHTLEKCIEIARNTEKIGYELMMQAIHFYQKVGFFFTGEEKKVIMEKEVIGLKMVYKERV